MDHDGIAAALQRVEGVLKRRPEFGIQDDTPATALWQRGTRVVASHPNGTQIETDMPTEIGGSGDRVTPGWLFRAGLATCAATSIELVAVAEGIQLDALEVCAGSRSDARGLFGMADDDGQRVGAGPFDMRLQVRIAAAGVASQRLRALVQEGLHRSPIPTAVTNVTALALDVEVAASPAVTR